VQPSDSEMSGFYRRLSPSKKWVVKSRTTSGGRMHDTHAARLWHLSRGKQQRVLVTDQELRRLAQQGRLHPEDLLWRRGFDAWRTAFSIPGLLTPPPSPESDVPPPDHGNAIDSASNFGVKLHKSARLHGLLSECVHLAKRGARFGTTNLNARQTDLCWFRSYTKSSRAPSHSRLSVGSRCWGGNTRHCHAEFFR